MLLAKFEFKHFYFVAIKLAWQYKFYFEARIKNVSQQNQVAVTFSYPFFTKLPILNQIQCFLIKTSRNICRLRCTFLKTSGPTCHAAKYRRTSDIIINKRTSCITRRTKWDSGSSPHVCTQPLKNQSRSLVYYMPSDIKEYNIISATCVTATHAAME